MNRLLMISVAMALSIPLAAVAEDEDFVTIRGDQFIHAGQVIKLKGTNYYPREHMWAGLWNQWEPESIQSEITVIRDLGMNCVRILVPYEKGGWRERATGEPPADRLRMLHTLIDSFGRQGIRSCVTLFDWETTYPPKGSAAETEHFQYIRAIVRRLRDNPYVLMWDVKNEPDHPSAIRGKDDWSDAPRERDKIVSWLRRMCVAVKEIDAVHPVSVGIRWFANVDECLPFVDVAMFHSYWPNIGTEQIPTVKRMMGERVKPIIVQEFGWPSHPVPCDREGTLVRDFTEDHQLAFYKLHLEAFERHGITGCLQWMTFDAKAYGADPKESFEQYFGLWRFDLSLKPAGILYRDEMRVRPFPVLSPMPPRGSEPAPPATDD